MKSNTMPKLCVLLMVCAIATYSQIVSATSSAEFCWRNSKTRGVGTIPNQCGPNEDKIGLLCYEKCPANYVRFGFDCHSKCPTSFGWRDDGLYCRLAQYWRGDGYPWKFGDPLNDSGMYARCQGDHGAGNCQKCGLVVFPKCRQGYYIIPCNICRPNQPRCTDFGLQPSSDISCPKKIIYGVPRVAQCPSNKVYDAGLCYNACPIGYKGIGPVCWLGAPQYWVQCGMGAAKNTEKCGMIIFQQVSSVGSLALNIATFGASSSARLAISAGKDATKLLQMKNKLKQMKQVYETGQKVADIIKKTIQSRPSDSKLGDEARKIQTADIEQMSVQDMVRLSAQMAAILDPTGIAAVVAAYAYPTCDKIQP